jgi:polyferredoxin
MALGTERLKIALGLSAKRGRHRYTTIRWIVGILFTVLIALLPLTGLLRFDMWNGQHRLLGEPADFITVAKAFVFPFLAVNIGIILMSRFLGRYLCGFVCPVGSLSRISEWIQFKGRSFAGKAWRASLLGALSLLMASITFSFWVDWRVFAEGSPTAVAVSASFLGSMTLGLFILVYRIGLRFCRGYCPSGVYFALLGPETRSGIEFAHPENCTECKACITVCPMDLHPTEMTQEPRSGIGFYPNGMSNHALCIRCGDCVAACEGTTARYNVETPLRMGTISAEAGRERSSSERPSTPTQV